ncbi:MAG: helix-turn-helix domain-containing protein [Kamptonema sp. SIO4C4]|nr:helix-turn-helix domain-containing protein [Kamptonema sp. SIO4C4]
MTTPPPLSETQIRRLATTTSFLRGQKYYQAGAVHSPTLQGNVLYGVCLGSQRYRVRVVLSELEGVRSACTCPYDWGGLCKHRVALLLAYLYQGESFQVRPPLSEQLQDWPKGDLIALVEWMSQGDADLLLLMRAFQGGRLPVDAYRPSLMEAFELRTVRGILDHLTPYWEMAQEGVQQGQKNWSGELLAALLEVVTESYTAEVQGWDYNGELCRFSQQVVDWLREGLQAGWFTEGTRTVVVEALVSAFCWDLAAGGIGYGEGAAEGILLASEGQWPRIESQLREAVQDSDWGRQRVARLLAQWEEQRGKGVVCPHCQSGWVVKNGQRRGKQNYRCESCGRQFVDSVQNRGYPPQVKARCLELAAQGYGVRAIARMMGVSHKTVSDWLNR